MQPSLLSACRLSPTAASPAGQCIAGASRKGCPEVEALLLCPSAGTSRLDLSTDLITVRSKEGFKEEGELLGGSMILPPA